MNYAPGIQDQRGQLIMQGNLLSQRSGEMLAQVLGYFINQKQRKDEAIGTLSTLGGGGDPAAGYGAGAPAAGAAPAGGSMETGDEPSNPAMDQAEIAGKRAEALRNVITSYNQDPQLKTALKAKSVGELEGMLKGYAMHATMQEHQAHMEDYQAQAEERRQRAADDQGIGLAVNRYANAPDVPAPVTGEPGGPVTMRPATADERFRYALSAPGLSGRAVPKLLDALMKYGQSAEDNTPTVLKDNPYPGVAVISTRSGRGGVHVITDPNIGVDGEKLSPTYTEDPITGARALLYGKSAQSTGFNPEKAAPQLMPQHDEEGNLVGWSQLDARGHATFIPNRAGSAVLKQAVGQDGNPINGYYVDSQGKLHDTRSALQKSLGGAAAPGGGAAAPAAQKFKSREDVVAAFKSGKLQRNEAAKILNEQFGVPLK